MGWLAIPIAVVLAGCELLFPLDGDDPPPPPDADLTPRPCFRDNFDAPTLDPFWQIMDAGSPHMVVSSGDELVINFAQSVDAYNGVESVVPHRVDRARVSVHVAETGAFDGFVETTFHLMLDGDNHFLISVGAGSQVFAGNVGGRPNTVVLPYNATDFRYWSIRHEPGAFVFETKPALAGPWDERHRIAFEDPGPATIRLYGGTYQGGRPDPGSIRFDDFALEPVNCL